MSARPIYAHVGTLAVPDRRAGRRAYGCTVGVLVQYIYFRALAYRYYYTAVVGTEMPIVRSWGNTGTAVDRSS